MLISNYLFLNRHDASQVVAGKPAFHVVRSSVFIQVAA